MKCAFLLKRHFLPSGRFKENFWNLLAIKEMRSFRGTFSDVSEQTEPGATSETQVRGARVGSSCSLLRRTWRMQRERQVTTEPFCGKSGLGWEESSHLQQPEYCLSTGESKRLRLGWKGRIIIFSTIKR